METPDCVSDPDFQDDLSLIVAYWNTFGEDDSSEIQCITSIAAGSLGNSRTPRTDVVQDDKPDRGSNYGTTSDIPDPNDHICASLESLTGNSDGKNIIDIGDTLIRAKELVQILQKRRSEIFCDAALMHELSILVEKIEKAQVRYRGFRNYSKLLAFEMDILEDIHCIRQRFLIRIGRNELAKDTASIASTITFASVSDTGSASTRATSFNECFDNVHESSDDSGSDSGDESNYNPSLGQDRLIFGPMATVLHDFLCSNKPWRDICDIADDDPTLAINFLQQECDSTVSDLDGPYRSRCLMSLLLLAKTYGILPMSLSCPAARRHAGDHAVWGGGFADIWKGWMNGAPVCFKVLRFFTDNGFEKREQIIRNFCSEALLWRNLKHPNILPFLGVRRDLFAPSFCLISPWMKNGNIMSFLERNPCHNRLQSITEIARGMAYLHSLNPPIVHGDIRGANILVNDDFHCCLCDFGLALAVESQAPGSSLLSRLSGSLRWLPPELMAIRLFDQRYVTARDIYSYGCTVVEIYSGRPPFSNIWAEGAIINEVLVNGYRPEKPSDVPGPIWVLLKDCFNMDASQRPLAGVLSYELDSA
ncbi:kinase-like domain-containing protein [Armillaria nabsnona]|nr:kinase-like domain-containing protein [Armillaria nabsnona]